MSVHFELPAVYRRTSIERTLADVIETKRSGALVRQGGKLRLVHFDALAKRTLGKNERLAWVKGERVLKLEAAADDELTRMCENANAKFALVSVKNGIAQLFSVDEPLARRYSEPSDGVRCQRPGRPPSTPAQCWYHYVPPNPKPSQPPNVCVICGAYVPLP